MGEEWPFNLARGAEAAATRPPWLGQTATSSPMAPDGQAMTAPARWGEEGGEEDGSGGRELS